mmetsp:Transcript_99843/g.286806  ORF Transcript_99843/g.286806 Transcript_99843/m.286806 type:complete len:91 (+) Transcript_99843:132-404(+)
MVDESPSAAKSPVSSASNGQPKSALRGGEQKLKDHTSESSRTDVRGNPIQKGGAHHMSFVDDLTPGKPVMEVREVEAYKNNRPGCGCTIA